LNSNAKIIEEKKMTAAKRFYNRLYGTNYQLKYDANSRWYACTFVGNCEFKAQNSKKTFLVKRLYNQLNTTT
jgi:hypothetical protein